MNDNMDTMMASLFNKDQEEFNNAFTAEIGDRLGEVIANKHVEVSSGLLDDKNFETEEGN
jgi:hypothetical protein